MKTFAIAAATLLFASTSANAAISLSSIEGPWVDAGFTPSAVFEFEAPDAAWNGVIANDTVENVHASPWLDESGYASAGITDGNGKILDLSAFADIDAISFYWGSIDEHNTLTLLDAADKVLATFTGTQVIADANGDQSDPATNRIVTLTFTGESRQAIAKMQFDSGSNAFEFDHVAVLAGVPEPTTWAMMLLGMGIVGASMRRRTTQVSFA